MVVFPIFVKHMLIENIKRHSKNHIWPIEYLLFCTFFHQIQNSANPDQITSCQLIGINTFYHPNDETNN